MTYLQDKKNRQLKYLQIIAGCIVIVVLFFAGASVSSFAGSMVTKSVAFFTTDIPEIIGLNSLAESTLTKKTLLVENAELKSRLSESDYIKSQNLALVSENNSLRKILHSEPLLQKKTLVTLGGKSDIYGTIIINSGKDKNIHEADYFVGEHGAVLGVVEKVFDTTSLISLLDASKINTDYRVVDSPLIIQAKGESRGVLVAQVPRETEVQIEQIVKIGSGLGALVGSIKEVSSDDRNPYKSVYIRMFDELQRSQYFYIVEL